MNETPKTLTFLAVAAVAALLAVVTWPVPATVSRDNVRGQMLYPDFKDPLAVASVDITEFDENSAMLDAFQVIRIEEKGKARWVIPSHDNYVADSNAQVAAAANALMRLKAIDMPSDAQGDQAEYGVVEPDEKLLKVGATGVGMRVTMKDKAGKELLNLVIGKEAGKPGLRYVRKVGQDPIYVVEANTDKLTTKFENWIERNLLDISPISVSRFRISDYTIRDRGIDQRRRIELARKESGEARWKLLDDQKFVRGAAGDAWKPVKLAADEELNTAKLDDMMYAFDDLKIVDVTRKPAGLSADLKAGRDLLSSRQAIAALQSAGFEPGQLEDNGPVEIYSNEGEMRIGSDTGVEYVLRFGSVAGPGVVKKADKKKGKAKDAAKDQPSGMNRFLFVLAEFNPSLIEKPKFEPLPELKKEPEKKPAATAKADAKSGPAAAPDAKSGPTAASDKKPRPAVAPDAKKADAKKPAASASASMEAERKALEAERDRIAKDNKRKQDEYEQKIADGKKRVAELNARFADWYYVISDEVFRKIHLGRDEIVKKKEKAKGDHAGHQHGDAPKGPADLLDKLKAEGPTGEK
ncbi:MAG: DUF4340 domain-containing protein [Thermoguttaceae bacterium]